MHQGCVAGIRVASREEDGCLALQGDRFPLQEYGGTEVSQS